MWWVLNQILLNEQKSVILSLACSSPASLACLLFLKHTPISGPLHILFLLPKTLFSQKSPSIAPHLLVDLCLHVTLLGKGLL